MLATSGPDVACSGRASSHKVLIPTLIAPLVGFSVGIALMVAILWIFRRANPGRLMRRFRIAQLASASVMAFSHGSNDAQKTMGVITLALFAGGHLPALEVPLWVKLASALMIGLGTYSGGRRIIRTLGMRLVKLTPAHGFAAETAASSVLLTTAYLGFPVSTTHVITTSVMGVGATAATLRREVGTLARHLRGVAAHAARGGAGRRAVREARGLDLRADAPPRPRWPAQKLSIVAGSSGVVHISEKRPSRTRPSSR